MGEVLRKYERLSREVREGLEQELHGFMVDMLWLKTEVENESDPLRRGALREKIRSMMGLLKFMMREVQRISTEIRSGVLDLGIPWIHPGDAPTAAERDPKGTRVLVADVHTVVRQGVRQILSGEPGIGIFGEAKNGHEVLDQIRRRDWDALVLDINMPGRGGLDLLREIKELKPRLPVLVLSLYPEEQYAIRALKCGASGYLVKESTSDELIRALRKILNGGKFVSAALAEKLAVDLRNPQGLRHEDLSDREFQVLRLIASGKAVGEIGKELHLSVKTVSTYRSRLLEKLELKTNAALVHYAVRNKLVE